MKKTVIVISILVVSCHTGEERYFDMDKLLYAKDTLRGAVLPEPATANSPVTRIFHTPYGLVCCTNIEGNVVQLLDISTGRQKATAGHLGRGPDEMLSAVGQGFDYDSNIFYCYDNMMKKLVPFEIGTDSRSTETGAELH